MSRLGGHFMAGGNPQLWIDAGAAVYKFAPEVLGASSQVPAGPLVIGKLDQEDPALGLTDWKALYRRGLSVEPAAELRFNAQTHIYVGPNKPRVNRYEANPRIGVWEDDNEIPPDNEAEARWYSDYCIEMMKRYQAIGKKRANFSFAVGTPEMSIWPHLLPAVAFARQHGHYLALHEYMGYEADLGVGWKQIDSNRQPTRIWHGRYDLWPTPDESYPYGWAALRYRYIYDTVFAPAGLGDVKLLITEAGCDNVQSVTPAGMPVGSWRAMGLSATAYTDHLLWYDRRLREDPYVVGAVVFTVGSVGGWRDWDIAGTAVETLLLEEIRAGGGAIDLPVPPAEPPVVEPPTPPAPPAGEELLPNADLQAGWTDSERWPMVTQDPAGWVALWNVTQGNDYKNTFAHDQPYAVGEAIFKLRRQLPPEEWPLYLDDESDQVYKVFNDRRPFWFRFKLREPLDLPAGRYVFRARWFNDTHKWIKHEDGGGHKQYDGLERDQVQVMLKVNQRTVADWEPMTCGVLVENEIPFEHQGGLLDPAFHMRSNWGIPGNFMVRGFSLVRVEEPQPEPEPPVVEPEPPPVVEPDPVIVDVSHHQGRIDWSVLGRKADAVIIRLGHGVTEDREARRNVAEAIRTGTPFATYHYFMPTIDPVRQGEFYGRMAREIAPGYLCAVDLEEAEGAPVDLPARAKRYIDAVAAEVRHKPMIYTSAGYWRGWLKSPAWGAEHVLWLAAWTKAAKPLVPAPWTEWALWQYEVRDIRPSEWGVQSGRLDMNRFNGSLDELRDLIPPPGEDDDDDEPPQPSRSTVLWNDAATRPDAWNAGYALPRAITADGYHPYPGEYTIEHEGQSYTYQIGVDDDGKRRVYYAPTGQWSSIRWIAGPGETAPAPEPEPEPEPVVGRVDLVDYLKGDGRCYMVQHPDGPSERFRTVDKGDGRWLQLKNSQWEEFWTGNGFIWRGKDTSAGDGNYYRQYESLEEGARWAPRVMTVGQTWVAPVGHTVQTYRKSDCAKVAHHRNGTATNSLTLVARHAARTWNGITVSDVIELKTHTGETMWFGRGYGLVAWTSSWGVSAIAHLLPAHEADNEPERGCFG